MQKDIARLKEASARTSVWADKVEAIKRGASAYFKDTCFIGHKSAKMAKRAVSTQQRQEKAIEEKSKLLRNAESAENLKLSPLSFHSQRLAALSGVEIFYGGRKVCAPLDFEIMRGERIALDGKNGCGKSSVLKLLCGENIEHSGTVWVAPGLKISYVSQNTDGLCGNLSDFAHKAGIDESLFKTILRKMDFERAAFGCNISSYSGGQKKKVLLAKSLCEQAHLYVWDEPLNFIDIYSRMQIENLLLEFEPTMIFVEHDITFRENIATKTVAF